MQGGLRRDMLRWVMGMSSRRIRRSVGAIAALGAALTLVGSAIAQQGSESSEAFSASERRQLARGELVSRPTTRRRGQLRLIGGSSWQVIDRSPEVTWRALCDDSAYPQMLPAVEDARVVAHRPGTRTVRVRHAVGVVRAQYYLRMSYDHGRRDIAFRLDRQRPNDLRAAWGFMNVRSYQDDPDRTILSYGVMADPGGGVFGGLLRGQIHDWLLRVPETVRSYLRGRGRNRY